MQLFKKLLLDLPELLKNVHCRRSFQVLLATVFVFLMNIVIVQESGSKALSAFSSLTIFDILYVGSSILSSFGTKQKASLNYSYGLLRMEVLSVFTCTMLAQLNAFFIFKESLEHIFENSSDGTHEHSGPTESHGFQSDKTMLFTGGVLLTAVCHYYCIYMVNNPAFDHVIHWCSSSWIQEQVAEVSQSICKAVPFLSTLLLPRLNPLSLIASIGFGMMLLTKIMIDVYKYEVADSSAAIGFALLLIYTWLPMTKFTGRILLQSTPPHLLGQRDKLLNEIGTLDGVLEVKEDRLWLCGFKKVVGTIKIRIRREANEQAVLSAVHSKLANIASEITVQLVKDDLNRANIERQFKLKYESLEDHHDHDHGHDHSHSHASPCSGHSHDEHNHSHAHDHHEHDHEHDHAHEHEHNHSHTAFNGSQNPNDFVLINLDDSKKSHDHHHHSVDSKNAPNAYLPAYPQPFNANSHDNSGANQIGYNNWRQDANAPAASNLPQYSNYFAYEEQQVNKRA